MVHYERSNGFGLWLHAHITLKTIAMLHCMGFYIEGGTNDLQIIGGSVIDERMSESNLKNRRVCVTGRPGSQVILQIDKLRYQKFTPDSLTELLVVPGSTNLQNI